MIVGVLMGDSSALACIATVMHYGLLLFAKYMPHCCIMFSSQEALLQLHVAARVLGMETKCFVAWRGHSVWYYPVFSVLFGSVGIQAVASPSNKLKVTSCSSRSHYVGCGLYFVANLGCIGSCSIDQPRLATSCCQAWFPE